MILFMDRKPNPDTMNDYTRRVNFLKGFIETERKVGDKSINTQAKVCTILIDQCFVISIKETVFEFKKYHSTKIYPQILHLSYNKTK
jgi:hypothetical protein